MSARRPDLTASTDRAEIPHLLTVKQAATLLQMNPSTVSEHLTSGRLKGLQIGREWRIALTELFGVEAAPSLSFAERRTAKTVAEAHEQLQAALQLARQALEALLNASFAVEEAHRQYEERAKSGEDRRAR